MAKGARSSARMSTGRKAPRPIVPSPTTYIANTSDSALIDSDGSATNDLARDSSLPALEASPPPEVKVEPVVTVRGTRSRRRAAVMDSVLTDDKNSKKRVREDEEAVTVKEEPSKSQRATKSERDQVGTQDQPTRKRTRREIEGADIQDSVRALPLAPAAVINNKPVRKSKDTVVSTVLFTDDEDDGHTADVGNERGHSEDASDALGLEYGDPPTFDDLPSAFERAAKGKSKQRSRTPLTEESVSDVDMAAAEIRSSHVKEARKRSLEDVAATNPGDGTKRLYGETTFIHGNDTLSEGDDVTPPSTPVRKHRNANGNAGQVPSSLLTPVRRKVVSSMKPQSRSPLEVKERTVYMEDLEPRGPNHRGQCEINNDDNKDPIINYENLPPLKRLGELLSWSGVNGHGQVRPSAWAEQAAKMSMSQLRQVIQFAKYGQMYNPSRINPDLIGRSSATGNAYLTVAGQPSSPAVFTTSVMITSSNIVHTKEVFGEPRRVCTGIAHNYEWQRMEAMLLAALGEESANAQIAQNSITFSTARNMSSSGSSPAKNPSKMFMRPAGQSSGGSVFARAPMSLQGIQTVPVLDARGTRFNMSDNLPKLDTVLSPFQGEIPEGACAWVGYTVNKYSTSKGANVNFNLLWVVVLGTAD